MAQWWGRHGVAVYSVSVSCSRSQGITRWCELMDPEIRRAPPIVTQVNLLQRLWICFPLKMAVGGAVPHLNTDSTVHLLLKMLHYSYYGPNI